MVNMDNKLVFYYCNVATALSILQNNEIWMTSVRNMNDGGESIGVYKMFFDLLEEQDMGNYLEPLFDFARKPGAIQLYENCLGAYPEYVACFSKNSDSVSQWISYADNGQGVAIGFDETAFIEVASRENLYYQSITYVSKEDVLQYIPGIYEYLLGNLSDSGLEMMDIAMNKIKQIYSLGITLKTVHYSSEAEKRIIYKYPEEIKFLPKGWNVKKIKTYAKKDMINTCVPLQFPKEAIKKIVTGPKYQKNYFEIETAMEILGYPKVEICESNSCYR